MIPYGRQSIDAADIDAFLEVRRKWDPDGRIRSAQSMRLFGW